jgi:5'-phosphate synthase pdxT subunit
MVRAGILALQGNVALHRIALEKLGALVLELRKPEELSAIDVLVMPGGESSALLRLMSPEFKEGLKDKISSGLPTLATCAGLILLAKEVSDPEQESLNLLDISVQRNGYGRQLDSFVEPELTLGPKGSKVFSSALEGVFIRAPKIQRLGDGIDVLASYKEDPVLIQSGNIIAASFHPELTENELRVHKLLIDLATSY